MTQAFFEDWAAADARAKEPEALHGDTCDAAVEGGQEEASERRAVVECAAGDATSGVHPGTATDGRPKRPVMPMRKTMLPHMLPEMLRLSKMVERCVCPASFLCTLNSAMIWYIGQREQRRCAATATVAGAMEMVLLFIAPHSR